MKLSKSLAIVWVFAVTSIGAFVPSSTTHRASSSSSLSALPPMIIGPMIKKFREEQDKKNQPMVNDLEASKEAPGLRVGKDVWRWPPIWPYDGMIFKSSGEAEASTKQQQMSSLTSMLSGVPQLPTSDDLDKQEAIKFDPLDYWGSEQADEPTVMDAESIEKLKQHYAFYLRDGMSLLELGAAEESYLPSDLKFSRHVGVGANLKAMEKNSALGERMVVDLNNVITDRDVDNDDFRRLAQEPFDAVIMANTVDYLTNPREVFRSAWYMLKPGGVMIASFRGNEVTKDLFQSAQTAIWKSYNDDQHMWMVGSFFHFSAGEGWEDLLGFDISPDSAKNRNKNQIEQLLKQGNQNTLYVVQATKGYQDESIDLDNLERSLNSLCWMLPVLEDRDKQMVVPRLTRAIETADNQQAVKDAVERNIQFLPDIYQALSRMDQFAFTFAMQSQLAADLICDPDFCASDEQIKNLKEGLGLRTPGPDFWKPVGQSTSAMAIEDKISLLGYLVPRFDSGNPAQEEALKAFVTGLKPTYSVIRSKCPDLSEADVELIGSEFLAAEVLKPGLSTRYEFAAWLASMEGTTIRELLSRRKSIRESAKDELVAFREAREERERTIEELKQKMQEQIKKAREERSLVFNPRTEKMEVLERK